MTAGTSGPGTSAALDLLAAGGMAFLAGATDVYGLRRLGDLFVSFMSGNTTSLGLALGGGDWPRAVLILGLVGLFVAGAALGAVVEVASGPRHDAAVVVLTGLALCLPLVWPQAAAAAFTLAMGGLNAALSRVGPAAVSLTYVTGTLVKFGQGLGRALCGRPEGWGWLLQAPLWLSLLSGAAAGAGVQHRLGADALWPLPALAALVALPVLARHAGRGQAPGRLPDRPQAG